MLKGQDRLRTVPDPVGFRDLFANPKDTHEGIREHLDNTDGAPLELIPFADGPTKTRFFSALDPRDDVALQVLGGRLIGPIEQGLPTGVVSMRRAKRPPEWRLVDKHKSFRIRRQRLEDFATITPFPGAVITDIVNYFASVDRGRLVRYLVDIGAPAEAVEYLYRILRRWQVYGPLEGIPIGPDISAILGNIYLAPVDQSLTDAGLRFIRLTDDYVVLLDRGTYDNFLNIFDTSVGELGLLRSRKKTVYLPTALDLMAHADDQVVAYLASGSGDLSHDEAETMFLEAITEGPEGVALFRFLLGWFRHRRNTFPLSVLAANPELFRQSPKQVGDYLTVMAALDARHVARFVPLLEQEFGRTTTAVRIHLLRAMSLCNWGRPEAELVQMFMTNGPNAVRVHAIQVWARTPTWSERRALDLAEHGHFATRRSAIASLRQSGCSDPVHRGRLDELKRKDLSVKATCSWVLSDS